MKPRRVRGFVLLFALIAALAGCEKDGGKASGPLAADDLELFKSLPAGGHVVIGGNYMKLQDLMASTLGKLAAQLTEEMGAGMKEWMACFTEMSNLRLAGSAKIGGGGAELRMVFKGAGIPQLAACAQRAKFASATDPDGKFIAIDVPIGPGKSARHGYLELANGALYNQQVFVIGLGGADVTPATRAQLEAEVAGLARRSAADDAHLMALVAKVDRARTMWFVGSAAGTPIADKLELAYGSFDIAPGIAIDVHLAFASGELADQLESGIDAARRMAKQLPAELRSVIDDLRFQRDGKRVRLVAKLDDKQLSAIMSQMGGMGMGRR